MAADNRTPEQSNSQTSMFCSYTAQVFVLVQRAFSGMAAALAALVPCLAERSCGPTSIGRIVSARLVGAHMALVDLALKVARAPRQWREVWDHLVLAAATAARAPIATFAAPLAPLLLPLTAANTYLAPAPQKSEAMHV